ESTVAWLRKQLKQPGGDAVRDVRAIQVLEYMPGREARTLLHELAAGPAGAPLTHEARAALQRLARFLRWGSHGGAEHDSDAGRTSAVFLGDGDGKAGLPSRRPAATVRRCAQTEELRLVSPDGSISLTYDNGMITISAEHV